MSKRPLLQVTGSSSHFPDVTDFNNGTSKVKTKSVLPSTTTKMDPASKKPRQLQSGSQTDFKLITPTPLATGVSVPLGHCIVSEKWRGTKTAESINKVMKVTYMDGMGVADFQPGNTTIVMLWGEAEIIRGEDFLKEKLKKLYKQKDDSIRQTAVIIFSKSDLTSQYLQEIEQLSVIEFGIPIVPLVKVEEEIGQLMQQFEIVCRKTKNPFRVDQNEKKKMDNIQNNILLALVKIPNLSEKKARELLKRFGSLKGVARAKQYELAEVLGTNMARGVADFFKRKNTV